MPASPSLPVPVQQRSVKPNIVDGPKPSSILLKTSPSKPPTTNQDAGDGSHVVQGVADNVARIQTLSGDALQTTSPTKNAYIGRDSTASNGALVNAEPYPREV